jgi:hypothetical protein
MSDASKSPYFPCIKIEDLMRVYDVICGFYLEETCLEAGEGAANAQVQFLTSVHTFGFVLIGFAQIVESCLNIFFSNGRKVRTEHVLKSFTK